VETGYNAYFGIVLIKEGYLTSEKNRLQKIFFFGDCRKNLIFCIKESDLVFQKRKRSALIVWSKLSNRAYPCALHNSCLLFEADNEDLSIRRQTEEEL
jgi:hypothetical protein